jgi:hypothetical protein
MQIFSVLSLTSRPNYRILPSIERYQESPYETQEYADSSPARLRFSDVLYAYEKPNEATIRIVIPPVSAPKAFSFSPVDRAGPDRSKERFFSCHAGGKRCELQDPMGSC